MTLFPSTLLRMMLQTEFVEKNPNTHFIFNNFCLKNPAVCEIMWKNMVEPDRTQMIVWRMRSACRIPKATHTHTRDMQYSLIIHGNKGFVNAPQCYVIVQCLPCLDLKFVA